MDGKTHLRVYCLDKVQNWNIVIKKGFYHRPFDNKKAELIKKAKKHYIHFLKFCNKDEYPINLLELLDNSKARLNRLIN